MGPELDLQDRTIRRIIDRNAERFGSKAALRDDDREVSYAGLRDEGRRRGGALVSLGIGWQAPVLFMMDNHLDHVLTWLGTTYHGRVQVQVNTAYKGRILSHVVNDSLADTILVEDRYCERLAAVADDVPALRRAVVRGGDGAALDPARFEVLRFEEVVAAATDTEPEQDVAPWDRYGIIYTSGTTGVSKGVVIPHAQPYSYCSPEHFRLADEDDVVLATLPQFHIGGQWACVLSALLVGATAVVVEHFSASSFWDDIRRHGATQTTLVSTMADFVYRQPERPDDASTPLRKVLMAPVIREADDFKRRFGVEICIGLGQTEASCPIVARYGTSVPGGSGWLRPDFEARIVDEHDVEVPLGATGELVVRPLEPWSTMLEYNNMPDATRAKWRNLWLHTGDMVRQDPDDLQFYFVDRDVDRIRRRGENVSSFEVEAELRRHPDVQECAVVAVPSEVAEDEIKACAVLVPGGSADEPTLHRFLCDALPYFMVPRYVEIVTELPKTPTQRVQKAQLREAGVTPSTWDAVAHGLQPSRRD